MTLYILHLFSDVGQVLTKYVGGIKSMVVSQNILCNGYRYRYIDIFVNCNWVDTRWQ